MLTITINNNPAQIGDIIPQTVTNIEINYDPFVMKMTQIPAHQVPLIKQWFDTLWKSTTAEYVLVNNTLILTKDIKLFYP